MNIIAVYIASQSGGKIEGNTFLNTYGEIQEGMEILYSFIRTYFYDTLKKAGMDPIILPPVRFN